MVIRDIAERIDIVMKNQDLRKDIESANIECTRMLDPDNALTRIERELKGISQL